MDRASADDHIPKNSDMSRLTSVGDLLAVDHAGMRMWSFITGEKSEDGKQIDFKTFLYNWRGSAIVFSFT